MLFFLTPTTTRRRLHLFLSQDLLRGLGALLPPRLLRRRPSPGGRRHLRPHPLQGVQGLREAREAVHQEAGGLPEQVRARLSAGARHQGLHREDQAPVRELRQVRPAVWLRRSAPPHRQRRPAALGRVHHPGPALPLHRRLDRVGRTELPDRHPGRQEAHHEGDHHRRPARHPAVVEGLHLASGGVQGARQRGARRQRRVIRRCRLVQEKEGTRTVWVRDTKSIYAECSVFETCISICNLCLNFSFFRKPINSCLRHH